MYKKRLKKLKETEEKGNMLKNKNGITLIALVVTIVVLLILAGVSISLILDNNGIIQKSKDAKEQYGQARGNEQADLDNVSEWINEQAGIKSEVNWNKILEDANSNPDKYKHPEQSDTNGDIGIGTDGKPVNMDLWTYRIADGNRKEIILNSITGSGTRDRGISKFKCCKWKNYRNGSTIYKNRSKIRILYSNRYEQYFYWLFEFNCSTGNTIKRNGYDGNF